MSQGVRSEEPGGARGAAGRWLSAPDRARLGRRLVATAIVLGLTALTASVALEPARADADVSRSALEPPAAPAPALPPDWAPPRWYPTPDALQALSGIAGAPVESDRRAPRLRANSAFAYDLDSGEVLLAVRADERWPVASLTKLVSSLTAVSESPDMDRVRCVDALWYPTRSGARSKFSTGDCYRTWDVLGSMLVASDNRAAYGMQVASGLPYEDFIERMNQVAGELGMDSSSFSDPSGLEDDNLSTARDIARAVVAAAYHPVLSVAISAPSWRVERMDGPGQRRLHTTNRLAGRGGLEILAAKTGYTDTARYCYAALVRTASGRRVVLSVLGANRSSQRWADVNSILRFVD